MKLNSTAMWPNTRVNSAEIYECVRKNVPSNVEGVFIGGNGIRTIGAIQRRRKTSADLYSPGTRWGSGAQHLARGNRKATTLRPSVQKKAKEKQEILLFRGTNV